MTISGGGGCGVINARPWWCGGIRIDGYCSCLLPWSSGVVIACGGVMMLWRHSRGAEAREKGEERAGEPHQKSGALECVVRRMDRVMDLVRVWIV